jgi:hypothetical protein
MTCNSHRLLALDDGPALCPGCPACVPGRTWSGPLREWAREPRSHRICRASARLMREVIRLRGRGLSQHEAVLALGAVIAALEEEKHGRGSAEEFIKEREER